MGWKISWIAFRGITRQEVLTRTKGADTQAPDDANESPFSIASLPGAWTVLFSNNFEFASAQRLTALSTGCTVVACQVHEGVMVTTAYGYENGAEDWAVEHNADNGIRDLTVRGVPPSEFAAIRDRLAQEQEDEGGEAAEVDLFSDIPIETAKAACGYRHDEWTPDPGQQGFTTVAIR